METGEITFWILGGYGILIAYVSTEVFKLSKQVAVLQKSVDDLAQDVREFLRTEVDALKQIAAK